MATTLAVRRSFTADDKNVDDCGGDGVGRMLADLLAATVLPVDAEGVEVLNLTGSTGVLLPPMHGTDTMNGTAEGYRAQGRQNSSPSNVGLGETSGVEQERAGSDGRTSPRSDFVFSSVFRDALMSPLCRTTHLALSTARGRYRPGPEQQNGPPVREGTITTENKLESVSHGPYYYIGPKDVLGLCEAASACSSLRYLDLAGSDLSGSAGATAAAAAVSCLLRSTDIHGVYDSLHDVGDFGQRVAGGMGLQDVQLGDNIVSVSCGGGLPRPLTRLSLRACRLGAAGLSAVLGAVTAGVVGKDAADQNRPNCASDTEARKWGTTGSNVNLRGGVQSPFGQGGGEESRRHGRDGRGGRQRRHQALTMLPRLLDLADNRPPRVSTAGGLDVRGNRRGDRGGGQTGREGMGEEDASLVRWQAAGNDERDAVAEIAAALRLLENEGMAIMAAVDDFAGKKPSLERCAHAILEHGTSVVVPILPSSERL